MEPVTRRHSGRSTPALLKDLRTLKVAVLHPDDSDGQQVTQQLQRIGCQVQAFWPPPPALPEGIHVVFLAVRPDTVVMGCDWSKGDEAPTLIAIVNYENPTVVETVLRIGAKAVLPSPVRSFGLLSALVVARQVNESMRAQSRRLRKLEDKLLGAKRLSDAKDILMRTRQISETAAYDFIRSKAMSKRVTTEEIAAAIISANEFFSPDL
jgi:AmiR/NasT family two-component response regulator